MVDTEPMVSTVHRGRFQIGPSQQGPQPYALLGQHLAPALLAVDDAHRVIDGRAQRAQLAGRDDDLPARGHYVFDDEHPTAGRCGATWDG
jgi:hypothetical protein